MNSTSYSFRVFRIIAFCLLGGCAVDIDSEIALLSTHELPAIRARAAKRLANLYREDITKVLIEATEDEDVSVRLAVTNTLATNTLRNKEDVSKLALLLNDDSLEVALSTVKALMFQQQVFATSPLLSALDEGVPEIRIKAAHALGKMRGRIAIDGLHRHAQTDSNELVRTAAIRALSEALDMDSISYFKPAIYDPCLTVRLEAVRALAKRPSVDSLSALSQAVKKAKPGDGILNAAAKGLLKIRTPKAVTGLLEIAKNSNVQQEAFDALADIEGPESDAALKELLSEHDLKIKRMTIDALGNGKHEAVASLLPPLLKHYELEIQKSAAYALAAYGDNDSLPLLIADLKHGANRALAIDAIVKLKPKSSQLIENVACDVSLPLDSRAAAIYVLGELRHPSSVKCIKELLRGEHPQLRAAAAYALGAYENQEDIAAIKPLLSDENRRVQMFANYCAIRLGDESYLKRLSEQLLSNHPEISAMAARLLAQIPTEAAAEELIIGLVAFQVDVKLMAIDGMARRGIKSARVLKALGDLSTERNIDLQRASAMALGKIGTKEAIEKLAIFVELGDTETKLAAFGALSASKNPAGAWLAAKGMTERNPKVLYRALKAFSDIVGEDFGLSNVYIDNNARFNLVILAAQRWWNEHENEYFAPPKNSIFKN